MRSGSREVRGVRATIQPGRPADRGPLRVPGDKSIAHRWLMLAATAVGPSRLLELPPSLDVRSTAECLAAMCPPARPALEAWTSSARGRAEGHRSTWNVRVEGSTPEDAGVALEVEGEGRRALVAPDRALDCGNSGTSMRLLMGLVATSPFRTVLRGDDSLMTRPMERVAEPLRAMGADVRTLDGHPPVDIGGGPLDGRTFRSATPSAQVKGALLLAGADADGTTTVHEPAPTRDHTERAFRALGAPVVILDDGVSVRRFQHDGFEAAVPGDPSSAAFLIAASALAGSSLTIERVGLNPSRLRFLDVMGRMGVPIERTFTGEELGEPVGTIHVPATDGLRPVQVDADEVPLVIDEVPVLAMLAACAPGDSRFVGAGELRVKESDRLAGIVDGVRALGGVAAVEGDDLVLGGGGLTGGSAEARGDHRLAMAFAVAGLAAERPVEVHGAESAEVSFPGFWDLLATVGAEVEAGDEP
jgi:3-phosphoshikimate 1-carboxyvinyltransferase